MSEITLASLAMAFDVASADPAIQKTDKLTASSRELENQARKTEAAVKSAAGAHGASGTAAGQAEASMRALAQVYDQARDRLGRFAQVDGNFRLSQEATVLVTLRNAQAQAALAKEQAKAAATTASYAAKVDQLRAGLDPFAAVQLRLAQNTRLLDEALAHGAISARQYEDALSQVTRAATSDLMAIDSLNKSHGSLTGSSRTLNYAMLNMSRQASDLGVGFFAAATSGKPLQMVFMTLAQQTPQVIDIFADLKTQGIGVKTALSEMATAARGLVVTFAPWIAGALAVGAAVYLLNKRHEEQTKRLKALNKEIDEFHKKVAEAAPTLNALTNQTDLAQIGTANFTDYLRKGREQMDGYAESVRKATIELWKKNVAEAQGRVDAAKALVKDNPAPAALFVNSMGKVSQWANSREIRLAADATKALGGATTDLAHAQSMLTAMQKTTDLKAFTGETDKATKATKEHKQAITADAVEVVGLGDDVLALVRAQEQQNSAAGQSQEALKRAELATAAAIAPTVELRERVLAAADAWERQIQFTKDYAAGQKIANDAANANIRTFEEQTKGQIHFSSALEIANAELEAAARLSQDLRYDIEDVAHAINDNDWTSAFASLSRVLMQVKAAFDQGATSAQKYAAAAGVAQAVGGAVGGTGGAAISGAASGAMAGATIGSVVPGVGTAVGAVVGGIIGGLGGIFGSSSAKKKARQQAAAQAAAEEAQRQQQIADYTTQFQIDTLRAGGTPAGEAAAVAMERAAELAALAKLSPALVDLKQKYYDAADAAKAAADAAEKAAEVDAKAAFFATNFLTDAEQLAPVIKAVNDNLKAYGLSAESSRDTFKALVLAQDLTTEAGRNTYAALLNIAPAFDKVATSAETMAEKIKSTIAQAAADMVSAAGQRVDAARSALQAAYDAEKTRLQAVVDAAGAADSALRSAYDAQASSIQGVIDKAKSFSESMRDFGRSILSEATGAGGYASAQAEYQRVRGLALAGDTTAQGQFQSVAQSFLKASQDYSGSALAFMGDRADVLNSTEQLAKTADTQASLAEQQLAQLKSQVGALIDLGDKTKGVKSAIDELLTARGAAAIAAEQLAQLDAQVAGLLEVNTSVLSVKDAILGLNAAIKALADAKTVQANGTGWMSSGGGVAVPTNPGYSNPYGSNGELLGVGGLTGKNAAGQATFAGFTAAELAWTTSPLELGGERTSAAQAIIELKKMYGPNVLPGFAKGGAFMINGFGGIDQNLLSINGQPAAMVGQGEIVTVTPPSRVANDDGKSGLVAEVRALRNEVAGLRQDNRIIGTALAKATNQPQWSQDWDVDGLPPERAA